ncbi:hypothetical protein [Caballeronia sp. dw_276]|uniref:hypothetical protein n=1 Tax=Caballeronia sp. dw_276 TaxID=2719795 RepID=UPI001BD2D963|nr:hypothetical protein [Caballeronia sp. dw_276]
MNDEPIKPAQATDIAPLAVSGTNRRGAGPAAEDRIKVLEAIIADLRAREALAAQQLLRLRELETQLRLAQKRAEAAEERASVHEANIALMQRSTSWRVTSPVRVGGQALLRMKGSKNIARNTARQFVLHGAAYVRSRPALRERIALLLAQFPGLRARMIRLAGYNAVQGYVPGAALPAVETVDRLTARGRKVHADILAARTSSAK